MSKILVVDDDKETRETVKKYAEFDGYEVEESDNGMEAVMLCRKNEYDLVIMDVVMPKFDGFSACQKILERKYVPVIFLTARKEELDKIHGFEVGAQDYVTKPFSPRELMLRIKAVLSRRIVSDGIGALGKNDIFEYKGLKVDLAARLIKIDDKAVMNVRPKEYDLLLFLIKNRGVALSREKIINNVWGYDYFGGDRTLDSHIKAVRIHLGKYRTLISTIRGVGYRFEA